LNDCKIVLAQQAHDTGQVFIGSSLVAGRPVARDQFITSVSTPFWTVTIGRVFGRRFKMPSSAGPTAKSSAALRSIGKLRSRQHIEILIGRHSSGHANFHPGAGKPAMLLPQRKRASALAKKIRRHGLFEIRMLQRLGRTCIVTM